MTSARPATPTLVSAGLVLHAFLTGTAALVLSTAWAAPKRGGEVVFAQEAQVAGLDMHFSSAISTRNIAMHIYECLLTRDESNGPIPELAERIVTSAEGLTYTFPLRKGVLFDNGKPRWRRPRSTPSRSS